MKILILLTLCLLSFNNAWGALTISPAPVNGEVNLDISSSTIYFYNLELTPVVMNLSISHPAFNIDTNRCLGKTLTKNKNCYIVISINDTLLSGGVNLVDLKNNGTTILTLKRTRIQAVGSSTYNVSSVTLDDFVKKDVIISNRTQATKTYIPVLSGVDALKYDLLFVNRCQNIASGRSCTFSVKLKPQAAGSFSAIISEPQVTGSVLLSSTILATTPGVIQPLVEAISVDKTSLDFGTLTSYNQSFSKVIDVTNTGTKSITPIVTVSERVKIVLNRCSSNITPGENCKITIAFKPLSSDQNGPLSGSVLIESSSSSTKVSRTVNISAILNVFIVGSNPSGSCTSGNYYDGASCQPITYVATYSSYSPAIPTSQVSCDGTVTSNRTISVCRQSHDNAIVSNSLCAADPTPTIVTQSPAGNKLFSISNGSETRSCALGSSVETFVSRSCDSSYFDNGSSCSLITYTAVFSAYSPAVPSSQLACDGTVTSNRTISTCTRNDNSQLVATSFCSDPEPQIISQSPAGTKDSIILNGYETYFCAGGSTTQQYVSRTCDQDFHDDNLMMCAGNVYFATYSQYSPPVPSSQIACDGTVTSNRSIIDCKQQHDNATVLVSKCSDPSPQIISQSPAGNKLISISNGQETYSCALGSSTEVFASRSCDSGFHESANSCIVTTYIASYNDYVPAIPVNPLACDGTVISNRTINDCRQSHDKAVVSNTLCGVDPTPQVITQSPAGQQSFLIVNGSEIRSCPVGSSSQTFVSRTCNLNFFDDGDSCEDTALAAYTPTFSAYSPVIPSNLLACDGTITSNRTILTCTRDVDSASVATSFCSDPTPQVITQSPAGNINYSISNGSETFNCAQGSTSTSFVSRSCNSGYTNNGSACVSTEVLVQNITTLGFGSTPCAIGTSGAYCWGSGTLGQLGNNPVISAATPIAAITTIGALSGKTIKSLSIGSQHSCAIGSDDLAYCWGRGQEGQLGNNSSFQTDFPVAVNTSGVLIGKTIKEISSGSNYSCAIASDNKAYCWGTGTLGQLGNNAAVQSNIPVAVDMTGVLIGKTIKSIYAGSSHACVIASDDKAYCWGAGTFGQLGNNVAAQSNVPVAVDTSGVLSGKTIKSISLSSSSSTCAIASDNLAYCWGSGSNGQLGNNSATQSLVPVAVVSNGALAGKTIKSLSVHGNSSAFYCAIASDDKPYCWGISGSGQLGYNSITQSLVPVAVDMTGVLSGKTVKQLSSSSNNTCVIASDDKIYCWGIGNTNLIGDGNITNALVPRATDMTGVLSGKIPLKLSLNSGSACVISTDSSVSCWGSNNLGILAIPSASTGLVPVAVNNTTGILAGKTFLSISGGTNTNHTCGIASDNLAYCWGSNGNGQLGDGTTNTAYTPVAVSMTGLLAGKTIKFITGASNSTCAIASDDLAYCWGSNTSGQLGNNSTTQSLVPVAVNTSGVLAGKTIKSIAGGLSHMCAIASDDLAYCWGQGTNQQLGNGSNSNSLVPVAVQMTTGVLSGKTLKSLDAGVQHNCVIANDNKGYCWGAGAAIGGAGGISNVPIAINMNGVLSGKTLLSISAGNNLSCAVASDNLAYCWGTNINGDLGNGGVGSSSLDPIQVTYTGALNNLNILQISAGSSAACVLASNEKVYCWGLNNFGQLGTGNTTNSNVPIAVSPFPN